MYPVVSNSLVVSHGSNRLWRVLPALAMVSLLVACAEEASPPPQVGEKLTLAATTFSALPGWQADNQSDALVALQKSCRVWTKKPAQAALGVAGQPEDWRKPCAALQAIPDHAAGLARAFFMRWFTPYTVNDNAPGLFTGYYQAELHGAWQRGGKYQTPLWQMPDDLITVDLTAFNLHLKGQRIVGKVAGHKLEPYDDRAAVARDSLVGRAKPLLWVDDPIAAFFMEIQGSGRISMDNGEIVNVGYDGQNGHTYTAIGKPLAKDGSITRPVTMEKIRTWLKAHPDKAQAAMNLNQSVIFFRRMNKNEGAMGAEGVALTPQRSLAVDPTFVPLGVPLWLDAGSIKRLVIAQDTGGAIKGAVRGDMFWGFGPGAEAGAGAMQATGHYYLLLPKTIDVSAR